LAYTFSTNPGAGGYAVVAAPGTSVSLLSGKPAAVGEGFNCSAILITSGRAPGTENTGRVYIGEKVMNRATGDGVVMTLDAGEEKTLSHPSGGNRLAPQELYLDADNAGDGARFAFFVA
jgi:hypothetical protein